jgi:hypothetical protein
MVNSLIFASGWERGALRYTLTAGYAGDAMVDRSRRMKNGRRPTMDDDGVDASLIRWMLGLTPQERLQALQDYVDLVTDLRRASPTD